MLNFSFKAITSENNSEVTTWIISRSWKQGVRGLWGHFDWRGSLTWNHLTYSVTKHISHRLSREFVSEFPGRQVALSQSAASSELQPRQPPWIKDGSVTAATEDPEIGRLDLFSDPQWMIQTFDFLPSSEVWLGVGVQKQSESNSRGVLPSCVLRSSKWTNTTWPPEGNLQPSRWSKRFNCYECRLNLI